MKRVLPFNSGWRFRDGRLIQAGLPPPGNGMYFTDLEYTPETDYVAAVGDRLRAITHLYEHHKEWKRPLSQL